jgi:hypothetical protein
VLLFAVKENFSDRFSRQAKARAASRRQVLSAGLHLFLFFLKMSFEKI